MVDSTRDIGVGCGLGGGSKGTGRETPWRGRTTGSVYAGGGEGGVKIY